MSKRFLVLVLVIGLIVAGCAPAGGESESAAEPQAAAGAIRDVIGEVGLLTGESNLGEKPLLQWSAVDGAAEYSLAVIDADGEVYWAWRGSETEVTLGGGEANGPAGQTAYLFEPMTWTVVAYDSDAQPIAISIQGSLAP